MTARRELMVEWWYPTGEISLNDFRAEFVRRAKDLYNARRIEGRLRITEESWGLTARCFVASATSDVMGWVELV